MKYDFENCPNRHRTLSSKWNVKEKELPMWVADMDFMVAPEIQDYLRGKVDEKIYGYSDLPKEWSEAYSSYYKDKYSLLFDDGNLTFSLGVIPSVSSAIREFTKEGDKVALFVPNYHIFFHSITNNNRSIASIPLLKGGNRYEIPWEEVERTFKRKDVTFFLMSNPHNPSGKIFTALELERLAALGERYGVFVLSDEIHGEITEPSCSYVPYASILEGRKNSLTCLSPTKAWNIAGLQTSAVLSFDQKVTQRIRFALNKDEVMEGNFFSYGAAITAYTKGKEWLKEMNAVISLNREVVSSFLSRHLPSLSLFSSSSTYLLWIDISALPKNGLGFADFLRKETGLFLSNGDEFFPFGENGDDHFLRMNVAASLKNVNDALERLKKAVSLFIEASK